MDIAGKVFIVTGGASGLGEGTVRMLAAGGGKGVTFLFFWNQTPTRVDELRFTVTAKGQSPQQFSTPVNLTWRADPQPEPEPANRAQRAARQLRSGCGRGKMKS